MGHIQEQKLEFIEVDLNGGGPEKVYFRKMNLYEMDLVDKAREIGRVDGIIETFLYCARKKDGSRMFDEDNRSEILRQFDPDAVLVTVNAINAAGGKKPPKGK